MKTLFSSATRVVLMWLCFVLPVLVWFGKVDPGVVKDALLIVLGGFFTIKSVQGTDSAK